MLRNNTATDMECPICYCDDAKCHLVCGHSFCQGCTKEWWLKSCEPNCPMCRAPLYFKGMRNVVERWDKEREEKMIESVYARVFNEILEELEEGDGFDRFDASLVMFALNHFDERFRMFTEHDDWEFDEDELYELVSDISIIITKQKIEWEIADILPNQKLLFVPKGKRSVYRPYRLTRDRTTHTPPTDLYTLLIDV